MEELEIQQAIYRKIEQEGILERSNQMYAEMIGTGDSLDPFVVFTSAARKYMTNKFRGQKLHIKGAERRRIFTGIEEQVAEYHVGVKANEDSLRILKIIPKYRRTLSKGLSVKSPMNYVIYEFFESGKWHLDVLEVERYFSGHKNFGFEFNVAPISVGQCVEKGFEFSTTPSIDEDGQYCYGLETNVAYLSIPEVNEDGVVLSKSYCERLATTVIGSRIESWGSRYYPLNLYGDETVYKPFPDIGDKIHPSGLVMCLRAFDPFYDVVNMTPRALMYDGVDYDSDRPVYGEPNAEVYDITVTKNIKNDHSRIPTGMEVQTDFYFNELLKCYNDIYDFYISKVRERGRDGINMSFRFHGLITEIVGLLGDQSARGRSKDTKKVKQSFNRVVLDDVRVELKYFKEIIPIEGYKLTDCHGGKAVCVAVWDDDRMPLDSAGNRADLIMDHVSALGRLKLGGFYEQYINAAMVAEAGRLVELIKHTDHDAIWQRVLNFYSIVSPLYWEILREKMTDINEQRNHINCIISEGFYLWLPSHSPSHGSHTIKLLLKYFPATYGPITYTGSSGRKLTTKQPVLIGSCYFMLLNKIGDQWSGVTGSKTQHHGVLAKLHTSDRDLTPGRTRYVKIISEADGRLIVSAAGSRVVVELLDRSNSPESNRAVCESIINADNPSNIESAVDRTKVLLGNNRANRYCQHVTSCAGAIYVNDTLDNIE